MLLFRAARFLVTAGSIAAHTAGKQHLPTPVCASDLCQEVASDIVANMDETVDPCVDFYAHAFGRWNPTYGYDYGQYGVLMAKISVQLQGQSADLRRCQRGSRRGPS
ncbi:endothelin-converting enzyme 1-like [Paramacrobiotus metropolitanus]|uniref:endothelin-converting enzyme 1-like n=1 Tax=Paramacrobiotus metropolitanus TaxID=2943436 RepID=UPI00244615C1|nr:endothelin-converting enzyme 1-like [Paramacrobiotus metropolitanus]